MLGALIGGCSADPTDATQSNRVNETPLVLPEAKVVPQPPATALTILPSVNEVLVAVPERWRSHAKLTHFHSGDSECLVAALAAVQLNVIQRRWPAPATALWGKP